MSSEVLTQALLAGVQATFGQGRIFNVLSASGPLTIVADRRSQAGGQTQPRRFTNVPAGTKFTAPKGDEWTYLQVTSAINQNVTIFIGDEDLQFNNAVTVTGTALVAINPSSGLTDTADTVQAFGTQTVIAANAARRRITIGNRANSAANIRVSGAGGAGHGIELAPGVFTEFDTTASLTVRNDAAAGSATWYAEEEI